MLPRLAVRRHCLRGTVHWSVLYGLAHRTRTAQGRSHTTEAVLLRMFPAATVPRLLGGTATAAARLETGRDVVSGARGAGRGQCTTGAVQGQRMSPLRVVVWRWGRHRTAPHSGASLHVRQRHPRAHARNDARLFRHIASSRARVAVPGHARQSGGQRLGRRAPHGRRHQPRARRLRGSRVRAAGSERRPHAGVRGDRERSDVVVPCSRYGHHYRVVDGEDCTDVVEGCLPPTSETDGGR